MENSSQEIFFESVRNAMSEGIRVNVALGIIATFGLIFLISWLSILLLKSRHEIKATLFRPYYWIKGTRSKQESRKKANFPVTISTSLAASSFKKYRTTNLSPGGMFLQMENPFPVNTSFSFVLNLHKQQKISGLALVRWSRAHSASGKPRGMGCEFVGLSEKDTNLIRLALRKHSSIFSS